MLLQIDDVRRLLAETILTARLAATPEQADQLAATLAVGLTPALNELAGDGPAPVGTDGLMTAAEALFVRDTVAKELETAGGAQVAERLLLAGYIDVQPILARHRQKPQESPVAVAAATGPLHYSAMGAPSSATETGRIARRLAASTAELDALPPLPDYPAS
jgi:hypothetical protein